MNKKNNVLVIAAHPDDEILGCGATIAKHIANGDEVNVIIMAEGITSRDVVRDKDRNTQVLSDLASAAHEANKFLGVKNLVMLQYPDNRMDSIEFLDIVKSVETYAKEFNPNVVYTHYYNDLNIDHRITSQATMTAFRPEPNKKIETVLFFEVLSSTEWGIKNDFSPNWFEDTSQYFDKKLKAIKIYESEMRDWPHARSIESVNCLGKHRGSNIGVDYAEAFVLGRKINKE